MARYIAHLSGDFDHFRDYLQGQILEGSASASLEDTYEEAVGAGRCCVQVYERYSYAGGNRVSLNVTILGEGERLTVIAISAGGSQAMFFKLNTLGEEAFLEKLQEAVESYPGG